MPPLYRPVHSWRIIFRGFLSMASRGFFLRLWVRVSSGFFLRFGVSSGFFLLLWVGLSPSSEAAVFQQRRVALLIAHDVGWPKEDRPLRYSITGDLEPLRRMMIERMGFHPQDILVLLRPSKAQILSAFAQIKQHLHKTNASFLLFYYTGHADKDALHIGSNGRSEAFSYEQLKRSLESLRVKLLWAVLDACRTGGFLEKGAGAASPIQIRPPPIPSEKGRYIFTSGNQPTREFESLKGSMMTQTILRGLSGEADLSKNGVLTFGELLHYVKQRYKRSQHAHREIFLPRIEVTGFSEFALAILPEHRLLVPPHLTGNLQISLQKQSLYHIRMSTIQRRHAVFLPSGRFQLRYTKKSLCYQKSLSLAKGAATTLSLEPPTHWRRCEPSSIPPSVPLGTLKGPHQQQTFSPPPAMPIHILSTDPWLWTVEGSIGGMGLLDRKSGGNMGHLSGPLWAGAGILLGRQFFHVRLGVYGKRLDYAPQRTGDHVWDLHHENAVAISAQIEVGPMLEWREMHLFVGATAGALLMWRFTDEARFGGTALRLGGVVRFHKWFTQHWGLQISAWLGTTLAYQAYSVESPTQWIHPFAWEVGFGPAWRFD